MSYASAEAYAVRAALVVHRVTTDRGETLAAIAELAHAAADDGASLILFSETALTGFVATGDPAHDLPLGEPLPGPATDRLAAVARERRVWLGFGLYERERARPGYPGGADECAAGYSSTAADNADRLYDAAVLLGPDGAVRLHYRRITPQWHWPTDDPAIYRQGTGLPAVATPFGTCAFLLCGDLFSDGLVERVRALRADLLLVPFARRFDSEVADAADWERRERYDYARRAREAGAAALMVSYLADSPALGGCFGGALAVARDGMVLASLPPGREGALVVDLERSRCAS